MGTDSDASSVASAATSQVSEMTTGTVAAAKTTTVLPSNIRSGRYHYKRGFKKPATSENATPTTTAKKPKFMGA
eukprot:scaffold252552_cov32-Attheya_sp.AAC.1